MFVQRKKSVFVATQGFEKRFFLENFRKYFGNDVKWWKSVDMNSGLEGFEVESILQDQVKNTLIARMRVDSMREYRRFLDRRQRERELILVDHAPRVAAAHSPHLDLFPPLDDVYSQPSPSYLSPLPHRKCHSMPVSPLQPSPSFQPTAVPAAFCLHDEATWGPEEYYREFVYEHPSSSVPELRLSYSPSLDEPIRPLRITRSAERFRADFPFPDYSEDRTPRH
ncbi:hypothetical protein BDD12DRAFT_828648 [Trichophaea hybrida]|nr:hypothetical protein BDD12DRAFT_828648 [Trichophaea hybrida]